jgi:hypothetical protein
VEKKGERDVLKEIMKVNLDPFAEEWDGLTQSQKEEAERWCGDVPKYKGMMQCSCSS